MSKREALRELQGRLASRMQAARTEALVQSWLAVECAGCGLLFPSRYLIMTEILRIGLGDRRMRTVVDHLRGTHRSPGFEVVDTHAVAAAGDEIGPHAVFAQRIDRRLADLVLRELRDEVSLVAVVGARNGHVGLAAAIDDVKRIGLNEARVSGRRKTQHDFT